MIIPSEFDNEDEKKSFQEAVENFPFKLTDNLYVPGKNLIYSTASLSFALGMLLEGTGSKSRKEIVEQLLDLKDIDDEESAEKASSFLTYILDGHPDGIQKLLSVANIFYSHKNFELNEKFVKSFEIKYQALGREWSLNKDDKALEVIDNDAKTATKGLISKFFESMTFENFQYVGLDRNATKVYRINFISFWSKGFNEKDTDMDGEFHLSNGETIKVPMMRTMAEYEIGYCQKTNSSILRLPYSSEASDEQIYMVIILPEEGQEIKKYLDNFNVQDFNRAIDEAEKHTVDVWLPRFKMESEHHLIPTIQEIGIKGVFGPDSLLPWVLEVDHRNRKAWEMLAKRGIIPEAPSEVKEEETESVISMVDYSLPSAFTHEFRADRSFIYALLTENQNNIKHILFVGVMENPVS